MSAFKVPAVANMIVVSKSPSMPDTVFAAFSKACVPVFAALSADNTVEHCKTNCNGYISISNRNILPLIPIS